MGQALFYLFMWFCFMIIGLFGAIGVSYKVGLAYGAEADLLSGIITLFACWGIAFYCMHLSIKEGMK